MLLEDPKNPMKRWTPWRIENLKEVRERKTKMG